MCSTDGLTIAMTCCFVKVYCGTLIPVKQMLLELIIPWSKVRILQGLPINQRLTDSRC
ncbi:hypothetical protein CCP4SC76_390004 [Gammaproteobacteria bacterium]